MDKLLLTIEETRQAIGGQGRGKIYDLMKSGELESVLDGSRRFVLADSVRLYVEKLRTGQNQIRPVSERNSLAGTDSVPPGASDMANSRVHPPTSGAKNNAPANK